ncbi:hypothetical protein [Psychrobacter sp. ASPA161_6]|uniref:hypothetical protein n=1 Tax=Psychrobacter sp. ASPA161_6 TaxID=3160962 RepID=UPI003F7D7213
MAEPTNYLSEEREDSTSWQDRKTNNMTLDELRAWRLRTGKSVGDQRKHASTHNKYLKETLQDIEAGERLNNRQLASLIKSAKSRAGISASELLEFTLGDTKRNNELKKTMNAAVLDAYLANVKKASNKFLGGITPTDVINQSRREDINRANTQIFLASVFKRQGNIIKFVTNAGVGSPDTHHYVSVQLLDYPELLLGRTRAPSVVDVKKAVIDGKINFDCDCGRHRYWFRYLATVGKYNFGIDENRYPSTRNPKLTGVACKHALRVMKHLMSPHMIAKVKGYATDDIAKASNKVKPHRQTSKQLEREAARQTEALNNWNGRLHWSKKIKQAAIKAEKQIKAEQKRAQAKSPNQPTQAERASYQYAKGQIGKKGVPDNFKEIYQTEINTYQGKWGNT